MWTLIKALLVPFIWLDAFVQKRFDSVCFFLMRRFGIRKSSIRYTINALIISAYVGLLGGEMRYGLVSPSSIVIGGVFILILLLVQQFEVKDDREAEARPGVVPVSDRNTSSVYKVAIWSLLIYESLTFRTPPSDFVKANLTDGQHYFPAACSILFWVAYLAGQYLRKTPMNPPAEKARESALVPQPSPAKP